MTISINSLRSNTVCKSLPLAFAIAAFALMVTRAHAEELD